MRRMNWMITVCWGFMLLPGIAFAQQLPKIEGLIDVDYPPASEAKVEVNLTGALFGLAAKVLKKDEPEVADFVAELKALRVRVYENETLGAKTLKEVMEFYDQQLRKKKWEVLIKVREKDERTTTGVYTLTKQDIVSGLVVVVVDPKETTVVNLAGKIDLAKLGELDKLTGVELNLPDEVTGEAVLRESQKEESKAESED